MNLRSVVARTCHVRQILADLLQGTQQRKNQPFAMHLRRFGTRVDNENDDFLGYSSRSEAYRMTRGSME